MNTPRDTLPIITDTFGPAFWRRSAYLLLALPLSILGFVWAILTVSLGAGLAVLVAGLLVPATMIVTSRLLGLSWRQASSRLLDTDIPAPAPFRREPGALRTLGAALADVPGWRALLHSVIMFPLAIASFVTWTVFFSVGAGGLTYWFWYRFLPEQTMYDGTRTRSAVITTNTWYWAADTPLRLLLVAVVGLGFLVALGFGTRAVCAGYARLNRSLLGPTAGEARLHELRETRAAVVEDADARLRRLERELHDGTQARLTAIAMQVGEARDLLAADPGTASELLATAQASSTEALAELREIARGIHPPALDGGLPIALETLAARSPLPTQVSLDPALDHTAIDPAIQSLGYFAAAELLSNAAKHSGGTSLTLAAGIDSAGLLRLRVGDDGQGGAGIVRDGSGRHTGLAGLADRIAAVDGALHLDSPAGGPTVVDVLLPATAR